MNGLEGCSQLESETCAVVTEGVQQVAPRTCLTVGSPACAPAPEAHLSFPVSCSSAAAVPWVSVPVPAVRALHPPPGWCGLCSGAASHHILPAVKPEAADAASGPEASWEQDLLAGPSNLWPISHVRPRLAVNEAQHRIINLFKACFFAH